MLLFAPCKINIGLDVLRRREDGFHDLDTLMLPLTGLCDAVELTPAGENSLTVYGAPIDCPPGKNLCMRALKLVQERYGAGAAHIFLQKAVPFGAGLGGGSSDAAAVITLADRLFSLGLSIAQKQAMAGELGSDVPFFIESRAAMARGRGEVLSPADTPRQLAGKHILLIKPPVAVSTAEAYGGIVPRVPEVPLGERLRLPLPDWRANIKNAFEEHIFALHPRLGQLKEALYDMGAAYASMSGSGSALYAFFDAAPDVRQLSDDIFVYQGIMPRTRV